MLSVNLKEGKQGEWECVSVCQSWVVVEGLRFFPTKKIFDKLKEKHSRKCRILLLVYFVGPKLQILRHFCSQLSACMLILTDNTHIRSRKSTTKFINRVRHKIFFLSSVFFFFNSNYPILVLLLLVLFSLSCFPPFPTFFFVIVVNKTWLFS